MDPPGAADLAGLLQTVDLPPLARVTYAPESPSVPDVEATTREVLDELAGDLPSSGSVAIGVGSRGIHDIVEVARTAVTYLTERGLDPVVIPAMGSHGGATPAGQRAILEGMGATPATLGCPVDARTETEVIDRREVNGYGLPIHFSTAALEADAILPINRVKPHTDFSGRIESGICKMLAVGFGKQPGARTVHRHAKRAGYVPALEAAIDAITSITPVVGGIAIIENFHDETGRIAPVRASGMVEQEATLLEDARQSMPTLPFAAADLLVVDEMGKDVSGTGMDTNVIGRAGGADFPGAPDIGMIYVRGLTGESKGNANGIGLADVVHRQVVDAMDPVTTYTNALTSGNLYMVALPIALPTDEAAIHATMTRLGVPPAASTRVAWIRNTGSLTSFRVSKALLETIDHPALTVDGWDAVRFVDGDVTFEPVDGP